MFNFQNKKARKFQRVFRFITKIKMILQRKQILIETILYFRNYCLLTLELNIVAYS